jgi:hypothetical protein
MTSLLKASFAGMIFPHIFINKSIGMENKAYRKKEKNLIFISDLLINISKKHISGIIKNAILQ